MNRATTRSRSVPYRRWWPVLMVGALGLIISVTLFQYIAARERQLIMSDFELRAQEMTQTVERRVRTNFETVHSLAGLFVGTEQVSWQQFQIFGDHLLRYHRAVDSVQWIPRIDHDQRLIHETTELPESVYLRPVDAQPRPEDPPHRHPAPPIQGYQVRELTDDGFRRAPDRDVYTPIHYIAPWTEGHVLWGLDLSSFEAARLAMAEARRTGELVATPPIHEQLVWVFGYVHRPEHPRDPRAIELDGFVAGAFRIPTIVEGVDLRHFWPHHINIQIWDDSGPGQPVLLYGPEEIAADADISHTEAIELGRREWRLISAPDQQYLRAARSLMPVTVLASGVTGTALLVVLLGTIINRSERIGLEASERAVRERQQAAVAQLGVAALSGVPERELMQRICEIATSELDAEYAKVMELDSQGDRLLLRAGVGWNPGHVGRTTLPADQRYQVGYTLHAGEPVVVEDLAAETRFAGSPLLLEHGVASGMSTIIHAESHNRPQNGRFGVLCVHSTRPQSFSPYDVAFLQALANVLGQAIDRSRTEAELRESERRFRRISDATPAMIWMSDAEKRCTYVNRQWLSFTGRTLEQERGDGWLMSIHDEDRPGVRASYERGFDSREPFRMEYRLRRIDGQYRWILDEAMPRFLADGSFAGYVGACIDITTEKDAAEKLRTMNETLERRVSERTSRLRDANEQLRREIAERQHAEERLQRTAAALKRSNEELEQFAYIASHDLQEPLRKVQGFGKMLQESAGDKLDEQSRDFLQRMFAAVDRMRDLIDGLLAYSRITTKASPFERVDLNQIAQEVLSDLEMRIQQTDGEVIVHDLPTLDADPLQMRQLLQNLIANALKFHRPNEPPRVELWAESLDGHAPGAGNGQARGCRLFVRDHGIGIAPEHQGGLFTPFRRLHGRSSPYEGTGIGLAVCWKIAQRHGGRIDVQSQPEQGATFIVTLPCEPPDPQGDGNDP